MVDAGTMTHTLAGNGLTGKFLAGKPDAEIIQHSCHAVVLESLAKSSLYTKQKPYMRVMCVGVYVITKGSVIECPST